jgi:hypothetical protein
MNAHQVARIDKFKVTRDAVIHAENCLESCLSWDTESLASSIGDNYPEIESEKCEAIAEAVMRKRGLL